MKLFTELSKIIPDQITNSRMKHIKRHIKFHAKGTKAWAYIKHIKQNLYVLKHAYLEFGNGLLFWRGSALSTAMQGRTGSSNRPVRLRNDLYCVGWGVKLTHFKPALSLTSNRPSLIKQTGLISSGVIRNSGPLQIINAKWALPCNISYGGPPGRRPSPPLQLSQRRRFTSESGRVKVKKDGGMRFARVTKRAVS